MFQPQAKYRFTVVRTTTQPSARVWVLKAFMPRWPIRRAFRFLGHKTRSVFDRYNIASEGDLDEVARKLDAKGLLIRLTNQS